MTTEPEYLHVHCECHDERHDLRLMLDPGHRSAAGNEWPPELYINVQMTRFQGFFRRLRAGTKYILLGRTEECHWADTMPTVGEAKRMIGFLRRFVVEREAWEERGAGR